MRGQSRRALLKSAAIKSAAIGTGACVAPLSWATDRFSLNTVAAESAARAGSIAKGKTLKLLAPGGCETNLKPVIDKFQASSGITVELKLAPVDDMTARILLSGAGSGEQFDVAVAASYGIADLAEAEAILPLDSFAARFEPVNFDATSIYSAANTFLGNFYGYQTDGDVYFLFLNQKLWNSGDFKEKAAEELGYKVDIPSSWSDVDHIMRLAHDAAKKRYGGDLFRNPSYLGWEFILRLHENGTLLLGKNLEPQVNSDSGIRAAEAMLAANNFLRPTSTGDPLFENWRNYAKGDSLINIGWGGSQKYFRAQGSAQNNKLVAFNPPGMSNGKPGMPYFNWGWNYTVSRNASQPELAYLFTLFASSPALSTEAVRAAEGFFDPHQVNHYNDAEIINIYSAEFLDVHQDAMNRCIPDFYLIGQSQYMSVLNRFLNLIMLSQLTPKEGLQYAADEWNRLHRSIGLDRQQSVWQSLKTRIPNLQS